MPAFGTNKKPRNERCSVRKSEPSHVPEVQFRVHVLVDSVFLFSLSKSQMSLGNPK